MQKCILVIPCYNEASRLDLQAYALFLEQFPRVNLLFVNDGSTDQTQERLETFSAQHSERVSILRLEHNAGKAEAVRIGMLKVMGDADFVGYWDADLSTPLDELALFIEEFERFENLQIVMGSRVNILGRNIQRKLTRHYVGRIFATLVSILLNTPFYDTQCGAKVFRSSKIVRELFTETFNTRWIFDVELLQRYLNTSTASETDHISQLIHEVPLNNWRDIAGSKIRLRDFAVACFDLMKLYFNPLRKR